MNIIVRVGGFRADDEIRGTAERGFYSERVSEGKEIRESTTKPDFRADTFMQAVDWILERLDKRDLS